MFRLVSRWVNGNCLKNFSAVSFFRMYEGSICSTRFYKQQHKMSGLEFEYDKDKKYISTEDMADVENYVGSHIPMLLERFRIEAIETGGQTEEELTKKIVQHLCFGCSFDTTWKLLGATETRCLPVKNGEFIFIALKGDIVLKETTLIIDATGYNFFTEVFAKDIKQNSKFLDCKTKKDNKIKTSSFSTKRKITKEEEEDREKNEVELLAIDERDRKKRKREEAEEEEEETPEKKIHKPFPPNRLSISTDGVAETCKCQKYNEVLSSKKLKQIPNCVRHHDWWVAEFRHNPEKYEELRNQNKAYWLSMEKMFDEKKKKKK